MNLMPTLRGGDVIVTARAAHFSASVRSLELKALDEGRRHEVSAGARLSATARHLSRYSRMKTLRRASTSVRVAA
jgi:hypothetical protein